MDAASITSQSLFAQRSRPDQLVRFPVGSQEPVCRLTDIQEVQNRLWASPAVAILLANEQEWPAPLVPSLRLSQLRRGLTSIRGMEIRTFKIKVGLPELKFEVSCLDPTTESSINDDTRGFTVTVPPKQVLVSMKTAMGMKAVPVPGRDPLTFRINLDDLEHTELIGALKTRYHD